MSTLTQLTGYIFNAKGEALTTGKLVLTLQQDMVSVDGTKVAPFAVSVDLAAMSPAGNVAVSVYATVGASPAGLAYFVYFDPTPTDTSKPVRLKDGYWENYWAVPNSATPVPIGSFVSALRGQPSTNYVPLSGVVTFPALPVYADNAAATAGGLAAGRPYRTSSGIVMVRF